MATGFSVLAAALVMLAGASPSASDAGSRFASLVERNWQWRLKEYPTLATSVGVNDYNDRLEDAIQKDMLMHRDMPFQTVKDYDNYLSRLSAFPV